MKKLLLFVLIVFVFSGCQTTERDPRPPLMNTNAFANFVPSTNTVEDLDEHIDSIVHDMTNNPSIVTGRVFRIRYTEEMINGTIQ